MRLCHGRAPEDGPARSEVPENGEVTEVPGYRSRWTWRRPASMAVGRHPDLCQRRPAAVLLDPSELANRTPSRGEPAGRVRDRRVRETGADRHPGNGDLRSGDGEEIARLRPCSATSIRNSARDRPAPWSSTASSPPCSSSSTTRAGSRTAVASGPSTAAPRHSTCQLSKIECFGLACVARSGAVSSGPSRG